MSRFANLSERLSADLPASNPTRRDDEEDETTTSNPKDKEKNDMSDNDDTVKAEARAAGFKEANDRMNAVFASEHYEGHEAAARVMLGKNMTADDIIDVLAATPKIEPSALASAASDDAEASAREDLRKNLAASQPASTGAEGGEAPKADDADPVIKAAAKVNAINGLK